MRAQEIKIEEDLEKIVFKRYIGTLMNFEIRGKIVFEQSSERRERICECGRRKWFSKYYGFGIYL